MSPYIKADQVISDMAMALCWIADLSDIRLVRRELSCAGFDSDDIDQYAECAVVYAQTKRKLMGGPNQITSEKPYEDQ